jgi:uncharacterized membrane protein YesL
MRFSVINLLWIVFNIPIAFIVVNILFVKQTGIIVFLLIPLLILLPLLFFPATTAMFASARNLVMKEEGVSIRQYWRYFKENYTRSLLGGLVLTVVWTIWAVDYYYFSKENIILLGIFLILGIVLFVFTINFFSILSHYHMKLLPAMKNSFLITMGSPLLFFTVLISNSIILYFSLFVFKFLLPFFTGSLIAYLSFSAFYRYYLKVISA